MIVRPATAADAQAMVDVINPIIAQGGTTAYQTPYDAAGMLAKHIAPAAGVSCMVAEHAGKVIGFQSLFWPTDPSDTFPDGWAIIASFVAVEAAGKGAGQHLFAATKVAAQKAGVKVIDATIRADNTPGLRYYSGVGFEDYDRLIGVPLQDGTRVDRVRKRLNV
ncbi:GNAT family N-acetyltransferase [Yoonia sediminilitoris]|uniref:L-amino acid N-acyltransferase YncA n=1 Tax=Yoonia sediminilitoris TaxID=1286148 RepID=A0A2T6KAC6_9RHOB|nr:GNAT family N-acetyltransferase [Yoonia sediminilitoris]PUB11769.1 L-amino acid N-acyltransferase YncA [Yoonia sediminilitoris]RCW91846.1 L-amino acid N-acyltransferase YncA [Yoonia sediminilitoris]